MTDKDLAKELTNTLYTADLILRIRSLENLLVSKGICTREELKTEMTSSSREILKSILQKSGVQGDLDQILNDLEKVVQ